MILLMVLISISHCQALNSPTITQPESMQNTVLQLTNSSGIGFGTHSFTITFTATYTTPEIAWSLHSFQLSWSSDKTRVKSEITSTSSTQLEMQLVLPLFTQLFQIAYRYLVFQPAHWTSSDLHTTYQQIDTISLEGGLDLTSTYTFPLTATAPHELTCWVFLNGWQMEGTPHQLSLTCNIVSSNAEITVSRPTTSSTITFVHIVIFTINPYYLAAFTHYQVESRVFSTATTAAQPNALYLLGLNQVQLGSKPELLEWEQIGDEFDVNSSTIFQASMFQLWAMYCEESYNQADGRCYSDAGNCQYENSYTSIFSSPQFITFNSHYLWTIHNQQLLTVQPDALLNATDPWVVNYTDESGTDMNFTQAPTILYPYFIYSSTVYSLQNQTFSANGSVCSPLVGDSCEGYLFVLSCDGYFQVWASPQQSVIANQSVGNWVVGEVSAYSEDGNIEVFLIIDDRVVLYSLDPNMDLQQIDQFVLDINQTIVDMDIDPATPPTEVAILTTHSLLIFSLSDGAQISAFSYPSDYYFTGTGVVQLAPAGIYISTFDGDNSILQFLSNHTLTNSIEVTGEISAIYAWEDRTMVVADDLWLFFCEEPDLSDDQDDGGGGSDEKKDDQNDQGENSSGATSQVSSVVVGLIVIGGLAAGSLIIVVIFHFCPSSIKSSRVNPQYPSKQSFQTQNKQNTRKLEIQHLQQFKNQTHQQLSFRSKKEATNTAIIIENIQ